jgi:hypothetical protein
MPERSSGGNYCENFVSCPAGGTHGISVADEPQGVALLAYLGKLLAVSGEAIRDSVCG